MGFLLGLTYALPYYLHSTYSSSLMDSYLEVLAALLLAIAMESVHGHTLSMPFATILN